MRKRPPSFVLIIAVAVAVVLLAAINQMLAPKLDSHDHEEEEHHETAAETTKPAPPPPPPTPTTPTSKTGAKGKVIAVIDTDKGTMKVSLFTDEMPNTTKNFIDLANKKFYDGLIFHRVEDWVIQGGDPTGTGSGGSGKPIKLERNKKYTYNKAGMVGMARTNDPDSATSQFFIVTKPSEFLADNYALFGEVIEGIEVVGKVKIGDKMKSVKIESPAAKPADAKPAGN